MCDFMNDYYARGMISGFFIGIFFLIVITLLFCKSTPECHCPYVRLDTFSKSKIHTAECQKVRLDKIRDSK